ncbi:MAG: hypothetical protein P0120_05395 [Nitrospira sp.]|nr:hypothetical protein [Nitrospira sp.]
MKASTFSSLAQCGVCQEWGLSRSTFYAQQGRGAQLSLSPTKRRPKTADTDEVLTGPIRAGITTAPFLGESHRKAWVRLRAEGIRTFQPPVLRLMRQANLLVLRSR